MENKYVNFKLVAVAGPVEDKSDAPKFVKLDENFNQTNTALSFLEGKVKWIKKTHTPAKWRMWDIYWFKLFLEISEGKVIIVESTITNASKDLLNSLILNKDKEVKISLYLNKNWYPSSSVKDAEGNYVPTLLDFKTISAEWLHEGIDANFIPEASEGKELSMSADELEDLFN